MEYVLKSQSVLENGMHKILWDFDIVKVMNSAELWNADISWYSPNVTQFVSLPLKTAL